MRANSLSNTLRNTFTQHFVRHFRINRDRAENWRDKLRFRYFS